MTIISTEEIQNIQLDIMKAVHAFCIDNGLRYTLAYGSMLGAVRHKGFIPWNDDIDISMLREDYEKFISTFQHEYLKVYDFRKDADFDYPYAKVIDTRTVMEENVCMKNFGVDIDIFPLDDMFDDKQECEAFLNSMKPVKKKYRLKLLKPSFKNVWWKRLLIRASKVLVMKYSLKDLSSRMTDMISSINNPSSKYVGVLASNSFSSNCIMPRDWFLEYEMVPFCDMEFMCIKNTDEYLTLQYGDYMQLPPVEKRTSPHTLNNVYWK